MKKLTQKEMIKEVAMISAIISNTIFTKLYEREQIGYIAVTDMIADWSIEFYEEHKNINWEDVLMEEALKPKSSYLKSIICWDDCIIDYAHYKFENLK